jgi:hypothetical protein
MLSLQEISDRLEIHQLLVNYSTAIDQRRFDDLDQVFTPDAYIDYTATGGATGKRDEVVEWMRSTLGTIAWRGQHYITNIEADVTGDTAVVRAALFNPMLFPGMNGPTYFGGYYHHDLVRTPDGWRSRGLREEILWSINSPLEAHR